MRNKGWFKKGRDKRRYKLTPMQRYIGGVRGFEATITRYP